MIVIDTNILSYLVRAGCLSEFLLAFSGQMTSTALVRAELERGIAAGHTVLTTALAAFADGRVALIDLEGPELAEMAALRSQRRGLSLTDCSLLVAAHARGAHLLTHERKLQRVAHESGVPVVTLAEALDQAVAAGCLAPEQRDWVLEVSQA